MSKVLRSVKESLNKGVKRFTNSKFAKRFTTTFIALSGYSYLANASVNEDGQSMIINTINVATDWIRYLGAVVLVYAIVSFIFAWKSQNAEGQSSAATWLIVGALLCAIKTVVSAIGVI